MMKLQTKTKLQLFLAVIGLTLFACDLSAGAAPPPPGAITDLPPVAATEPIEPTATETVAEVVPTEEDSNTASEPDIVPTEAPPTATPIPAPTDTPVPFTSTLFGRVYHDVCINEASQHLKDSDMDVCTVQGDGRLLANGVWDETDQGLFGIAIDLYFGACAQANFVGQASTNGEGFYAFPNLPPGEYCVKMNNETPPNVYLSPNWFPGQFTSPVDGQHMVRLEADQQVGNIDFGWDYTVLPEPEKACYDAANLVESENDTDTTQYIATGLSFDKSWEVQNVGTCTWDTNYAVQYLLGEKMTAVDSFRLEEIVPPGGIVTITHTFTAPTERGSFIGAWEIVDPAGDLVPLGQKGGDKLALDVNVSPGIVTTRYGAPHWFDDFNDRAYWNPAAGTNASFLIEEGRMVMTSHRTDGFDSWILTSPDVANGYVEASFTHGSACSGYDRYGLIIRSDIQTGYFAGVTCHGQWSIRHWNGKKWTVFTGWQTSDLIRKEGSQANVIGVYMDEQNLTLYINGEKVYTTEVGNKYYHSGRFGVFIAAQDTNNLEIYVEEMGMWSFP